MNTTLVQCLLLMVVTTAAAQPQTRLSFLPVLKRTEVRDNRGQFALSYTTRDGTVYNERGTLKQGSNGNGAVLIKEGAYNYIAPDGTPIRLSYVADEFGYKPQGTHLPQSVQPTPTVYKLINLTMH